ncbi:Aste57867_21730 [Aphanomyces stellatus]|uniref:Aste57867_21730 protein n=1 Tax=Aphanomyces stellatus TaxID=120398 RepID=A0A485LKD2_9STRA|nr:hypothetical protein As57867_021661 [Aphanomyces stellatus]VFT98399.1 Aste57867_21730 [Aphanomyces stellatus]
MIRGRSILRRAAALSPWRGKRLQSTKAPILPIVDLSNEAQASIDLHHAFSTYGCCYLKGHGIDVAQETRVMDAAHSLFQLPKSVKETYHRPASSDGFVRGYLGLGAESGSEDLFEVKEAFSYGYEWEGSPQNPLQGENVWPTELASSHKAGLQHFYTDIAAVSDKVCRIASVALGKPPSHFSSFCTEGDTISIMRAFHYFPYSIMDGASQTDAATFIGSSPHTDWGFITLILQDPVGGLQLFHNDSWHDVPYIPGTIFVNGGDYLSLLTQGTWVSPIHRVINDASERYSMVFFYYPTYDAKIPISPKPTAASGDGIAKFNTLLDGHQSTLDMSFGAYISSKWANVQR